MRERLRHGLAALLVAGAASAGAVGITSTGPASAEPAALTTAVLRWGLSNESNNRAYAPDTFNFFSAGTYPDPGQGGVTMRPEQWQQSSGNVSIEKWNGTGWQPATWAGLGTDSSGAALGSPTAGTFSNHTFVFANGTGTADPATDTASIAWDGDVSVLYYSGMSYFVLSDPVLHLTNGAGEVTATLSGYASSQTDASVWQPVPAQSVTVATLTGVDVTEGGGFQATPSYAAVPVGGVPQVRTGAAWGSFPQSYVDYQDQLGSAAFWYSSGGAADPFKVALPLTVSLDAAAPVAATVPSSTATTKPTIKNRAKPAPTATPTRTPAPAATVTATVTAPAVAAPVIAAPPPAAVPTASAAPVLGVLPQPPTQTQLRLAAAAPLAVPTDRAAWPWWCGGACLLLAALSLLVSSGRSGARSAPPA